MMKIHLRVVKYIIIFSEIQIKNMKKMWFVFLFMGFKDDLLTLYLSLFPLTL